MVSDLPEMCSGGDFVFPAGILAEVTVLKPDVVLFSRKARHVEVVEISAGWDNLQAQWHAVKHKKYEKGIGAPARANG